MERVKEILIQYAQADFFERMHLFLQYPDLRDVFGEMERNIYYFLRQRLNSIAKEDILCTPCFTAGAWR
jgi:hypothetical protein